jgi:N-succinyldiaminopimelate aminotransferase
MRSSGHTRRFAGSRSGRSTSVRGVPLSPTLRSQEMYPFVRLNEAAAERRAAGHDVVDFGMGDPREPTDPAILQALRDGVRERMGYPASAGLPELRDAIAAWVGRRFDVTLDPDRHVIPTLGSKEAIYSFAQVVLDRDGRDTVVVTEPGYPVPGRGAAFAGARVVELPLLEENGFLPAIDDVADDVWDRASLVWLNTPNNPTGAVASRDFLARLAGLARAHDFVLASDEAYSELWFDEPPPSALELDDWTNVVVFNTLSKRSSMTGFRSGFVAGDPDLITALRRFRPNLGTAPQEFVQRASVVAWGDEEHVSRARAAYARKRALLLAVLLRKGLRDAGGASTMYLWIRVPDGETSEAHAERLLRHGIVVAPGSYLGPSGEGYVRYALVPTEDECRQAVTMLEDAL